MSSKVGPSPPVVIRKCGLRAIASRILLDISSRVSRTTVIRLTLTARLVASFASQCEFVFNILPIRSSLPMQIISKSTVKADHDPFSNR